MNARNEYEELQYNSIVSWIYRDTFESNYTDKLIQPVGKRTEKLIPKAVIEKINTGLIEVMSKFIVCRTEIEGKYEINTNNLEACDSLAIKLQDEACLKSGATGIVTNAVGWMGFAISMPLLTGQALQFFM